MLTILDEFPMIFGCSKRGLDLLRDGLPGGAGPAAVEVPGSPAGARPRGKIFGSTRVFLLVGEW